MKPSLSTDANPRTQTFNGPKAPDAGQPHAHVEPALIRRQELARRLSVSGRTVDGWIANRVIPYIKVGPRFYLFELKQVLAALRKHYEISESGRR
jgi:excisionase family DNA binding protein